MLNSFVLAPQTPLRQEVDDALVEYTIKQPMSVESNLPKNQSLLELITARILPTSKFPLIVVSPFGFIAKQVVTSEALITYEPSEDNYVCHVLLAPSREN